MHSQCISDVSAQFELNTEQERAYRIIANHAVAEDADQLKMYIGGMGGTGKSQVLKNDVTGTKPSQKWAFDFASAQYSIYIRCSILRT